MDARGSDARVLSCKSIVVCDTMTWKEVQPFTGTRRSPISNLSEMKSLLPMMIPDEKERASVMEYVKVFLTKFSEAGPLPEALLKTPVTRGSGQLFTKDFDLRAFILACVIEAMENHEGRIFGQAIWIIGAHSIICKALGLRARFQPTAKHGFPNFFRCVRLDTQLFNDVMKAGGCATIVTLGVCGSDGIVKSRRLVINNEFTAQDAKNELGSMLANLELESCASSTNGRENLSDRIRGYIAGVPR